MNAVDTTPIRLESLSNFFRQGIKKPSDLMVGVEWEKIGVYKESGRAIPYSGPRGVETILKELSARFGWAPELSDGHIIALKKGGTSITLEPGGQIELSGQKAALIRENADELYSHLCEIKKVSEPMGIAWLGIGMQPISHLNEIEWTPKKRYVIMREYLKDKGPLTYFMMKKTASVQVSIDYTSEEDAVRKIRVATALAPVFNAMFANSAIADARPNGFYSMRAEIWRHTDPARTGLVDAVFKPGFNFDAYRDFALDVPMFFIIRDDKWIPMHGMTFRAFLEKGRDGMTATMGDWETHLTTIFTEARLKTYIEIRSIDCLKRELGLSAAALIKGLFYNEKALSGAEALINNSDAAERAHLVKEVPKSGLHTPFRGGKLWDAASELVRLAGDGLSGEDRPYLNPLEKLILQDKKMPAEILLDCFGGASTEEEKVAAIIRCAAL